MTRDTLSPDRIIEITRAKGYFGASWRWRDDRLRSRCRKMARQGKLVRIYADTGFDYFKLPDQPMPKGFFKSVSEFRRWKYRNYDRIHGGQAQP